MDTCPRVCSTVSVSNRWSQLVVCHSSRLASDLAHCSIAGQVVPGQSIYLKGGQEAMLVETVDGSSAVVVKGVGGEAMVLQETAKGKRTKISFSAIKGDIEGVAALAAGTKTPEEAHNGSMLTREVSDIGTREKTQREVCL